MIEEDDFPSLLTENEDIFRQNRGEWEDFNWRGMHQDFRRGIDQRIFDKILSLQEEYIICAEEYGVVVFSLVEVVIPYCWHPFYFLVLILNAARELMDEPRFEDLLKDVAIWIRYGGDQENDSARDADGQLAIREAYWSGALNLFMSSDNTTDSAESWEWGVAVDADEYPVIFIDDHEIGMLTIPFTGDRSRYYIMREHVYRQTHPGFTNGKKRKG